MSNEQTRLAILIINESFGDEVEKVAAYLLKHGDSSLFEMIRGAGLKPNKVTLSFVYCCYSPCIAFARFGRRFVC